MSERLRVATKDEVITGKIGIGARRQWIEPVCALGFRKTILEPAYQRQEFAIPQTRCRIFWLALARSPSTA